MNGDLETRLIECLDLLEHGEQIEKILVRYPDDAAMLRPILETAVALDKLALQPSNESQATSRQKYLAEAASLSQTTSHRRFVPAPWQLILSLTSSVLVLLLMGFGLVFASDTALPGQPLYMVKRGWENIRLRLTTDSESQRTLLELFNQERLSEVKRLVQTNREAQVTFNGIIEAIDDGEWIVSGLKVSLAATTHIEGIPALGRGTQITGFTRDGRVIASHMILDMEVGPTLSVPTSTPESTPQPPAGMPTLDGNVSGDDNYTNDNNAPDTDHSVNNSDDSATDYDQDEKGIDSSNNGADVLDDGSNNGHDIDDDNEDVTAGEDSSGNTDDITNTGDSSGDDSDNEEKPIEIEDSKNNSDDSRDDSPGEVDGTGDDSETNSEDEESLPSDSPSPPNDNNSTYDDSGNSNKDDIGNDGEDHSDPEDDDSDDDDEVDDDDEDDEDAD
ncbi:MAG: hypothetical protein GWN33_02030 [Gammaproteobacteria bacterium]|nr:hypothetical protein [Gammaproteobacteria bacterium]